MSVKLAHEPTEIEYLFRARPVTKSKYVVQADGKRKNETTLTALIPLESSSRDRFFSAWLPDLTSEKFEITGIIGHPISSPCKFAVMRRNENFDDHHLFVMSVGVEDEIIKYAKDAILDIKILPASYDDTKLMEEAPDTARDIQAVQF